MGSRYFCVMCPTGGEWVGDYDAGDMLGECPRCHSGVGIFEVTESFPAEGTAARRHVDEVIAAGAWDRLDLPTPALPTDPSAAESGNRVRELARRVPLNLLGAV